MPRQHWNLPKAKIVTENGGWYYAPPALAAALVKSGLASVDCRRPFVVQISSLKKIGTAFIPSCCKNFIEEYRVLAGAFLIGGHRTRIPRNSVAKRPATDPNYTPLPASYGRPQQ